MRITFWGTRGSIATPGPETVGYGGDTSCVQVMGDASNHALILDGGTGIRRLGSTVPSTVTRFDLLLSHLHLDHIVGIGFFAPLFRREVTITIWGPPSTAPLLDRLGRYLSPPLFPLRLRDVPAEIELRQAPEGTVQIGEFAVTAAAVIHPDPTVGYRIEGNGRAVAYLPDHEPALGGPSFPREARWTSGFALAAETDLLIHDAQYAADEYDRHVGWGHTSVLDAVRFAELVRARTLALFHHDPTRDDASVDRLLDEARQMTSGVRVVAARQGTSIEL